MRWDVCLKCLFVILHLKLTWQSPMERLQSTYFPGRLANEWRGMIDSLTRQKAMCLRIWIARGVHSFLKTNCVGTHGATQSNEEPYETKINQMIYTVWRVPWEKKVNAPLLTRSLLLACLNLPSCLARQSLRGAILSKDARVGLETCKRTTKTYSSIFVEIPMKKAYIYILYILYNMQYTATVHTFMSMYFIVFSVFKLDGGRHLSWKPGHGCHFQSEMARKTVGSFCQLFSSDFGSDCCGNRLAESQPNENRSWESIFLQAWQSRLDFAQKPEGIFCDLNLCLCMFVPKGNAVTRIRIVYDLVRVVAVEFCKCLMLNVGAFMACPQGPGRGRFPLFFRTSLDWLLHD